MGRWSWRMALGFVGLIAALTLAACGSNSSAVGPIPTATAGKVRIVTDRAAYTTTEPIGVSIANASSQALYALDGLSGCAFLQLQQYDAPHKQWRSVDGCTTGATPQVLLIRPSQSEPFSLAPGTGPKANAWDPGVYRVALTYSVQPDGKSSAETAYSRGFNIA